MKSLRVSFWARRRENHFEPVQPPTVIMTFVLCTCFRFRTGTERVVKITILTLRCAFETSSLKIVPSGSSAVKLTILSGSVALHIISIPDVLTDDYCTYTNAYETEVYFAQSILSIGTLALCHVVYHVPAKVPARPVELVELLEAALAERFVLE